jgi:D-glucuronyl C5-epimerase C-terminus/Putative Ig domain
VLNAFIQALVGLYDFATLANDPTGRALFAAGDAEARIDVPHYDTGAWSLYDQSTESDLGYHELLDGFLHNLCNRTQNPAPSIAATIASAATRAARPLGTGTVSGGSQAPTGGSTAPTDPTGPTSPTGPASPAGPTGAAGPASAAPAVSGGTAPAPAPAPAQAPAPAPGPVAGNVFCTTATDFAADLHVPPKLALRVTGRLRAGATAHVHLTLSKISNVALNAVRAGRTMTSVHEQLGHGTRTLSWTPAKPGRYTIEVTATDLAGNTGRTSVAVTVAAATAARPGHA